MKVGPRSSCHYRAINPGNEGSLTVTHGHPAPQVRPHNSPNRTDSQADSAGSIPVTRSTTKAQVSGPSLNLDLVACIAVVTSRAISVQLARRNDRPRRAVVALAALGFDVSVDRTGDDPVSAACLMLVDHRRAFAVVTHPRHQVPQRGAAAGSEASARACPRHAVAALEGIASARVDWADSKGLNQWERKALEMSEERSQLG
jgi:hypothetical protein